MIGFSFFGRAGFYNSGIVEVISVVRDGLGFFFWFFCLLLSCAVCFEASGSNEAKISYTADVLSNKVKVKNYIQI